MAVYMNVEGTKTIKGTVTQKKHDGWIALNSVKLPTERPDVNTAPGKVTDRTTSQVDFKDIEISKRMDKASPELMQWNIDGSTHKVTIDICKEGGEVVLRMIMTDVILTNYDCEGDEEGKVEETLSLDYTKIQMDFTTYKADNTTPDGSRSVIYDLAKA